jgi:hypothetical protein
MEKENKVHFVVQRGCLLKATLPLLQMNIPVQMLLMNSLRYVDFLHDKCTYLMGLNAAKIL